MTIARALTIAAACLIVASSAGGCTAHDQRAEPASWGESLPLPSDGWKVGEGSEQALAQGVFHARREGKVACAWVGGKHQHHGAFRWPAGYRIAFTPTPVLLDAGGKKIAHEGQTLDLGGGFTPKKVAGTVCAREGEPVFDVQSQPVSRN